MKKIIISLFALTFAFSAYAQKAPQVLTVDIEKLYESFYKAQDSRDKFQSSVLLAEEEVKGMIEQGRQLYMELEEIQKKIDSPATADEAKEALMAEFEAKAMVVRQKEADLNQYRQTTQRDLQQSRQSMIQMHFDEIKQKVAEVAKAKGADLVLNSNEKGMAVIYFDASFDITEEVIAALNADKPAE